MVVVPVTAPTKVVAVNVPVLGLNVRDVLSSTRTLPVVLSANNTS